MSHLKALLNKNLIIWKRGGVCAYCEIILPLLFCLFFFMMRSLASREEVGQTSYLEPQETEIYIPYTVPTSMPSTATSYAEIIA